MKKIFFIIILTTLSFLYISCGTTKNVTKSAIESDSYDSENESVKESTEASDTNKKSTLKGFGGLESFLKYGNKGDFEELDKTEFFAKNSFGKVVKIDANIVNYYKDVTYGVSSNYQGLYYFCLFKQSDIESLEKAYNSYLNDFENKKLIRKKASTTKAYGMVPVTLRWGTLSNSTPNYGYGKAKLGYIFLDKNPYFCISVEKVYNEYFDNSNETARRESNYYDIYFTKAQMSYLLEGLKKHALSQSEYEEEIENLKDEY